MPPDDVKRSTGTTDPLRALDGRRADLPPRLLPVLYFSFAAICLMLSAAGVALNPRAVAGFFYHARMAAVVHLVTLGWISSSILGAIYIVGPMALRMPMPARAIDYWAFAFISIGVAGMAAHFWVEQFSGMAWSAVLVALGFMWVAGRVLTRLPAAPIPRAVKLHIALAFANVLGAASMGVLLGFDKVHHFLPGFVLTNVFAHAHLAAIGWAGMMVVGVAYRLLPMALPAAMPTGRSLYLSAVLLEIGAGGLFVALLLRSRLVPLFGVISVAGFVAFLAHAAWMTRHPRPAPPGFPSPNYGVGHVKAALVYLALAAVSGLALAISPPSERALRAALAYGVFGLVGFLAQVIVGMAARILPVFAWYWAFANTAYVGPVLAPYRMPARAIQRIVLALWLAGVPALAGGFFFDAMPVLAAGAWALLAATVLGAINTARILRHAFVRVEHAPTSSVERTVTA